ncbi:MAG TPA: enoyl-CoA hydratase/isomerase family protein, partial [Mycobacterium sp.]|nr:enoyl-CoA hydratase/isomerase family protein [Mycobacterium sp.]
MDVLNVAHHTGHVVVELHRPAQRNAINAQMVGELHRVCADLERQPQIL